MAASPQLPADPLADGGIAAFAARLRRGEASAEAATAAYLERIRRLDGRLGAFQHVAADGALATARAIDALIAAGTDLGPLMGVPVAIKDIVAVDGMPTTAGSKLDVAAMIGPEGRFVRALRRLGCVILGKTKTVEFAYGPSGLSRPRGSPWNPWDATELRAPGGSSSGSAAAVAAGLSALAVGTDTGGSVRIPSALCGLFGLKTTIGRWPTDGISVLSPTFDTVGLLAPSAADAALAYAAIEAATPAAPATVRGLRLGLPEGHFMEGLDAEVEGRFRRAVDILAKAGAVIVPVELGEAGERGAVLGPILSTEFIAWLGRDRFVAAEAIMDPVVWRRTAPSLELHADAYAAALRRQREIAAAVAERMAGLDAVVSPTVPMVAPPLKPMMLDVETALATNPRFTQNTQPGNLFGLSGASLPLPGAGLPVGLQLLCPAGAETRCLSIGLALEALFGRPSRPDVSGFA